MKTIIVFIAASYIFCTAFKSSVSLKEEITNQPTITDYRDAYTGHYFCQSSVSGINPGIKGSRKKINDTLTIHVSKDALDSILQIKIGRSILKAKLKSSFMYAYPEGGHWGGKFFGTDSLFLIISGGHTLSLKYDGKKK